MKALTIIAVSLLLVTASPSAFALEVEEPAEDNNRLYCVGILAPWCNAVNATCDYIFSQAICRAIE